MRTLLRNAKQSNWWRVIKLAWARWAEEDGDQRAAAFAYYLLLSLLPLTILLVAAGSLFVEREVVTQAVKASWKSELGRPPHYLRSDPII